jgi:hypothetical protein
MHSVSVQSETEPSLPSLLRDYDLQQLEGVACGAKAAVRFHWSPAKNGARRFSFTRWAADSAFREWLPRETMVSTASGQGRGRRAITNGFIGQHLLTVS